MIKYIFLLMLLPLQMFAQEMKQEGNITVNGTPIYYKTLGEGETVVLLHGGPGMDGSYLHPGMDPLSENFRLINYDQRGSGKSGSPLDSLSLTADQFVEDLEGLRKALSINKMHLMGHSWGGLLAMFYAIKYPDKLHSLILVSSVGGDETDQKIVKETFVGRLSPQEQESFFQMSAAGFPDTKEGMNKMAEIYWKPYVYDQENIKLIKDSYSDHTSIIQKHVNNSIQGYNIFRQLSELKLATLIIHGDYDVIPVSTARKIHQSIENSELVILEKCGHFPFIEKPQAFMQAVLDFVLVVKK